MKEPCLCGDPTCVRCFGAEAKKPCPVCGEIECDGPEDAAVDEACELLTARKELEGYLDMIEGALRSAQRRLRDMEPDEHAAFERDRVELRRPCEHDAVVRRYDSTGLEMEWCPECGAYKDNPHHDWRLPERER